MCSANLLPHSQNPAPRYDGLSVSSSCYMPHGRLVPQMCGQLIAVTVQACTCTSSYQHHRVHVHHAAHASSYHTLPGGGWATRGVTACRGRAPGGAQRDGVAAAQLQGAAHRRAGVPQAGPLLLLRPPQHRRAAGAGGQCLRGPRHRQAVRSCHNRVRPSGASLLCPVLHCAARHVVCCFGIPILAHCAA